MLTKQVMNRQVKLTSLKRVMAQARKLPVIPFFIVSMVVICAVFSPLIATHDPNNPNLMNVVGPPIWQEGETNHILGTDYLGRDVFSRLIYGARISLLVAGFSIVIGLGAGTITGIISAFFGGWIDSVIMRTVDITLSIPYILLAIVLAATLGPSFQNVILVLAIVMWPRFSRMIRGEALSIKQRDFVASAKVSRCSSIRIMFKHIFPNVINTMIVLGTLYVGIMILFEAILSFLGVGVPPPTPSWGRMVADGRDYIASAWWLAAIPGVSIMILVLSLNLIGDWLRDTLDPKRRQL